LTSENENKHNTEFTWNQEAHKKLVKDDAASFNTQSSYESLVGEGLTNFRDFGHNNHIPAPINSLVFSDNVSATAGSP